jgi:hypothetical protein
MNSNSSKQESSPFEGRYSELCRPDDDKSCFRCCPPIRPAGYDHLDFRGFLSREFRENRRRIVEQGTSGREITGFSCWGLGFLDPAGRRIGCLLHPARHDGEDLRDRTGYGPKCRRELCPESLTFKGLPSALAGFVLGLADGLDSFEYSSPRANPIFRLLRWGPTVVAALAEAENFRLSRDVYREKWSMLDAGLSPEIHRLGLEILLEERPLDFIAERADALLEATERFIEESRAVYSLPVRNRPFVHRLGLPEPLARFMAGVLSRPRATVKEAEEIHERLRAALKSSFS